MAGPRLTEAGYPGGDLIQPTVFAVIVATVILHGFSLGPLSRRLSLSAAAESQRLAVVGACPWATAMVIALHRAGVPVILIDTYPGALHAAQEAGVPTLQAELLSRHAEEGLADHPPDHLLAATRDELYNALVCTRLAPELGRERVYQLAPSADHLLHEDTGVSRDARGKVLGEGKADFDTLAGHHDAGWQFEVVPAQSASKLDTIRLLIIKPDGAVEFISVDHEEAAIEAGDRLLTYARPNHSRHESAAMHPLATA
ncbi:hypothetical protein [Methylobacterium sp. SI9]|uniref:hypothetical protein n=1 Tax=Methylobacterium guangdongense TaxID=3138811 RepID=UPI00313E075C